MWSNQVVEDEKGGGEAKKRVSGAFLEQQLQGLAIAMLRSKRPGWQSMPRGNGVNA